MQEASYKRFLWNERYLAKDTPWDIGYPSTPIKNYIDKLSHKDMTILVPGAGNAYEVEYLFQKGFTNVYLMDIAEQAITNFINRCPDFPEDHLLTEDFFKHEGQYDLIIEQTFFCAIDPSQRDQYVAKVYELLKPGGKLTGLLFDAPMNHDKPPFGGSSEEYRKRFEQFEFLEFSPSKESIKPREGKEIFIELRKK